MDDIRININKIIQLDLHVRAAIRDEDDIDALLDKIRERLEGSFDPFDDDEDDLDDKPKFLLENGTLFKLGLDGYYREVVNEEDYEAFENWRGGDDEE